MTSLTDPHLLLRVPWARALLAALALALPACSGDVEASSADQPPAGLHAAADLAEPLPADATTTTGDPALARRASALEAGFRARIAHWTDEAGKASRGKATRSNVRVAVCVREVGAREDLVALRADAPHVPASNMKLVTTAAALYLLGGSAEWVTPCEATGPLRDGVLAGDLVLRASGDPLWDPTGRGNVEPRLAALAADLHRAGLRRVAGDVVLDEGTFLEPGPGPGWPDPSQHWAEYCALSAGFTANGGVLVANVRPGAVGAPARVEVHPEPHGLARNYGVETAAGSTPDVRVGATRTTATVRGSLGSAVGEFDAEFAHPDPVGLFGALLADALERAGIRVDGTLRRERGAPRGVALAALRSPLADVLEAINADSRNGVADQVFLSLGHAIEGAGTRAGGARAVSRALERLGLPDEPLHPVDGSGLSRDDRVTARAIVTLLERVLGADPATAALYRDSLAVMGRKGTLEKRLVGTEAAGRVFAKSGWIAGVSSLSGAAELPSGHLVVFSILIEYPSELGGLNTRCFKPLQDDLVLMLFRDDA